MCKKAFTLAEMVIALVIIGTLAALTIPTLLSSTTMHNAQYVDSLKKAYVSLASASDKIMATNGGTLANAFTNTDSIVTKYCTFLKCSRICGTGAAVTGKCFNAQASNSELDTTAFAVNPATAAYRSFILADGMHILTNFVSANCSTTEDNISACGWFYVDINGSKGPNIVGRDIYKFLVRNTGIYLSGSLSADTNNGTCTTSSSGIGCTTTVLQQGTMTY